LLALRHQDFRRYCLRWRERRRLEHWRLARTGARPRPAPALAGKIELVFFDGEEAYDQFTATDGLYGSRYFAQQLEARHGQNEYRGGILWDMMGDRDLTITLPPDSPVELARGIFDAAQALKMRNYFTYYSSEVLDDHSPLNDIGIPTIDLIDFDYPPWHTAGDTLDKLSAQSLQVVGAVTLYYLSEIAPDEPFLSRRGRCASSRRRQRRIFEQKFFLSTLGHASR
jgi:hypothetical protein